MKETWPPWRLTFPFLYSRDLVPLQALQLLIPKLPWKPKSRRTKSGRWNSHFGRPHCLVSITHTLVPWPQRGLWLLWRADWKGAQIFLPQAPPGLLGALGTAPAPGDLRPQSPHLYSVVWAVFLAQVRGRNGLLGLCLGIPGQSVWEMRAVGCVCPAASSSHRWEDRGGGRETAQREGGGRKVQLLAPPLMISRESLKIMRPLFASVFLSINCTYWHLPQGCDG